MTREAEYWMAPIQDEGYVAQPCPDGCEAECKAIDPDWEENALRMFGFKVSRTCGLSALALVSTDILESLLT